MNNEIDGAIAYCKQREYDSLGSLAIPSDPELAREVLKWLRIRALYDPAACAGYTAMIESGVPLLTVLFAMVKAYADMAKAYQEQVIEMKAWWIPMNLRDL